MINTEVETLTLLAQSLDESFLAAVEAIYNCTGKVVITGMGKSGIIARKIAATLTSTGTPTIFLHPAEASDQRIPVRRRFPKVSCHCGSVPGFAC